jgi:hypothetical protein
MKTALVLIVTFIFNFIVIAAVLAAANILTVFAINGLRAWAIQLREKYGHRKLADVIRIGAA